MIERFKVGEHVAHIRLGDGCVTANHQGVVEITYDLLRKDGSHTVGCYDQGWFDDHPTWIFHRNTQPV